MEEVRFINRAPCCIACKYELENSSKRTLARIVQERSKCQKCKGCERLEQVKGTINNDMQAKHEADLFIKEILNKII